MTLHARLLWRWGPVVACAGLIFVLSSLSLWKIKVRLPDVLGADKVVHTIEYGALGLVLARAVHPAGRRFAWHHALIVIVATSIYGVSDELHQYYTPGRMPSVWDAAADVLGAALAAALWPRLGQRWPWLRA